MSYTVSTDVLLDALQKINEMTSVLTGLDVVAPTPTPTPLPTTNATEVSTLAEFKTALTNATRTNGVAHIRLRNDIVSPGPQILMQNLKNITIDGDGFGFKRTQNQKTNHMFLLNKCTGIYFENIGFDDNNDGDFGAPTSGVKYMIYVKDCTDITFDNAVIGNAKGYTLYVQQTNGFTFTNSEMYNAGVLGLYIGHGDNYSQRVTITDNHFHDISTNAVALLGVGGSTTNIVARNTFERNHKYGRWAVAAKYGAGFTGGGQLYIARADNVLVEYNTIKDGACLNGYHRLNNTGNGDVHGIELSELGGRDVRVKNLRIRHNTITNNDAGPITQNQNSTLDNTTVIEDNNIYVNNGRGNVPHLL